MVDRFEFVAADAMTYTTDERYDTVLVSNTLHMIGPQGSIDLLKRCYQLLTPGGRVIVQAQYLERQPGLASVAHAVEPHPTGRDP